MRRRKKKCRRPHFLSFTCFSIRVYIRNSRGHPLPGAWAFHTVKEPRVRKRDTVLCTLYSRRLESDYHTTVSYLTVLYHTDHMKVLLVDTYLWYSTINSIRSRRSHHQIPTPTSTESNSSDLDELRHTRRWGCSGQYHCWSWIRVFVVFESIRQKSVTICIRTTSFTSFHFLSLSISLSTWYLILLQFDADSRITSKFYQMIYSTDTNAVVRRLIEPRRGKHARPACVPNRDVASLIRAVNAARSAASIANILAIRQPLISMSLSINPFPNQRRPQHPQVFATLSSKHFASINNL